MHRPRSPLRFWMAGLVLLLALARPGLWAAELQSPVRPEFALPQPGRIFQFPADHGSHPEFKIEWWYITGHLTSEGGQRHGFQATFFRRASDVRPSPYPAGTNASTASPSTPNFATDEFFLAHMAWLDVSTKTFRHEERLNRRGWDAQAATNRLDVRNGNWSLKDLGPDAQGQPKLELRGGIQADLFWRMSLTPKKPLVVFGTNGVSRKAREASAASHYLTFPRLAVIGELRRGSQTERIEGEAWMDHELSSSQLGEGQVGWDWTSIHFFDGRELMAYRMRRDDGSTDSFSTVAWIGTDGRVSQWGPDRFTWRGEGQWRSPRSGGTYPATVLLTVPEPNGRPGPTLRIEPLCADQELSGGIAGVPYWEGACRVLDAQGKEVGRAFVEMTGYAGHLRRAL
jgi:predicted secreted hydrolase